MAAGACSGEKIPPIGAREVEPSCLTRSRSTSEDLDVECDLCARLSFASTRA